jgi:hypothetical protein
MLNINWYIVTVYKLQSGQKLTRENVDVVYETRDVMHNTFRLIRSAVNVC